MKLKEVIEKIDKSKANEHWVDLQKIASEVGINDYVYDSEERIKSYFYISWLCTDTHVGAKIYFLDDEAVCVSYQSARKAEIYNSLPVEIVERYPYGDKWKQTLIKFPDGKKELVTTKDIQIPIYTT